MCIWKDNQDTLCDSINYLASVGDTGAWKEGGYNEAHGITEDELYRVYIDYLDDFYRDLPHIAIQFGNLFAAHGKNPDYYDLPGVHANADPEKACICLHARHNMYISVEGRALTCMAISNDEAGTSPASALRMNVLPYRTDRKPCSVITEQGFLSGTKGPVLCIHPV